MIFQNCFNCGLKNIDPILKECPECTSKNLERLELVDVNHCLIIDTPKDQSLVCSSCHNNRFTCEEQYIRCNKCELTFEFKNELVGLFHDDPFIYNHDPNQLRERGWSEEQVDYFLKKEKKQLDGQSMKKWRESE